MRPSVEILAGAGAITDISSFSLSFGSDGYYSYSSTLSSGANTPPIGAADGGGGAAGDDSSSDALSG